MNQKKQTTSGTAVKLSILIPVYNEQYFVDQLVNKVLDTSLPPDITRELVIVDDCSTDDTPAILARLAAAHPDLIYLYKHERNQGKGAAIRTAIQHASGDTDFSQCRTTILFVEVPLFVSGIQKGQKTLTFTAIKSSSRTFSTVFLVITH